MRVKDGEILRRKTEMEKKGYKTDHRGMLVHRIVCKEAHGPFPSNWVVHHINEDKGDNRPENLIAMPREVHNSMHRAMRRCKSTMTRNQIQSIVDAYVNLDKGRHLKVDITIIIGSDQVKDAPKPQVNSKLKQSGSSSYR